MSTSPAVDALRLLVNEAARNEQQCGELLKANMPVFGPLLSSRHANVPQRTTAEVTTTVGRVDIVVFVEAIGPSGSRKRAVVWELKAPQVFLFEVETSSRAKPTEDLTNAENQLFHYVDQLRNDGSWKSDHSILSGDDVQFGGIIIGKEETLVQHSKSCPVDLTEARRLAGKANRVRREIYLERLELLTWSNVLELAPGHISNMTIKSPSGAIQTAANTAVYGTTTVIQNL